MSPLVSTQRQLLSTILPPGRDQIGDIIEKGERHQKHEQRNTIGPEDQGIRSGVSGTVRRRLKCASIRVEMDSEQSELSRHGTNQNEKPQLLSRNTLLLFRHVAHMARTDPYYFC